MRHPRHLTAASEGLFFTAEFEEGLDQRRL
jgi:hypothetical protein